MTRMLGAISVFAVATFAVADDAPTSIGSRRELFVDSALIHSLSGGAELRLHHPTPQQIAIVHDAPWEGSGCVYHSVFQDGNLYRMYYAAGHLEVTEKGVNAGTHGQFLCYAESKDGIHWQKPDLGLVDFNGSTRNNIVLAVEEIGDVKTVPGEPAVFKDTNPAAPSESRYKALIVVGYKNSHRRGLIAYQSPDGLKWMPMTDEPVHVDDAYDSQNLAFWDSEAGCYRAYWRYFTGGGYDSKVWNPQGDRGIRTATSADFLHWETPHELQYVDSPSEQLYTNAVKPYHRAPHLLLGFPVRYVERGHRDDKKHEARAPGTPDKFERWSASLRALPEPEHRVWRARSSERYGRAITESLLMASRDGVTFKRWNDAFLPPGIERPGTWNYGHQFPAWHLVETPGSLEGAPSELSLYATEGYWTGKSDSLRRYSLRLDGFVSVHAPMSGGELVTKPVIFDGETLTLNFATSAAGAVRVELQNESGTPIEGYSLADCEELFGNTIERTVVWNGSTNVSKLAGQPVRLRFVLNDADVFAYRFSE
jgi:hypothetical protein